RLLALVLLACPSVPADSERLAEAMTPLLLEVQNAPIPFLGSDGQIHLVYELWITNFSASETVIETVTVVAGDKVLATLGGAAVADRLQPVGRQDTSATMAPSTQALLFLHVVLPSDGAIPRSLAHRISARVAAAPPGREEIRESGGKTPVAQPDVVVIGPLCTTPALPCHGHALAARIQRNALFNPCVSDHGRHIGHGGVRQGGGSRHANGDHASYTTARDAECAAAGPAGSLF